MTFLGKTLIVLTFLMSLMFMMGSVILYSAHRNWKDEVAGEQGLQSRLRIAQETRQQLEQAQAKSKNNADWERAARRYALAVLEVRSQREAQLVAAKQQELEKLMTEHRNAIQTVEGAQANMERLRTDIEAERKGIADSKEVRNQNFSEVQELLDQLNQGEGQRRRLSQRRQRLTEQLSTGETIP